MTALLRCRGSSAEMAQSFGAVADPGLDWRETIWPGEPVPIVVTNGDSRRLTTSQWGLPGDAFSKPVAAKQRGALYSRDIGPPASRLRDPAGLRRCFLVVESFAYPESPSGTQTRSWFGLWDRPLAAWAGLCTPDAAHCAGFLAIANERVTPSSDTMPLILPLADLGRWLDGVGMLSLGALDTAEAYYRENLGERWSTGRLDDAGTGPTPSATRSTDSDR